MKVIECDQVAKAKVHHLLRETVPEMEPTTEGEAKLIDSETGRPLAIVLHIPERLQTRLRGACIAYPMSTTLRSSGVRNKSNVFGYASRNAVLRREGCRECSGSIEAPGAHGILTDMAWEFSRAFEEHHPDRARIDQERAHIIRPEWRMRGTQWTSGVLNETSPLPYHYDQNNLPTWNAMFTMRRGTRGGHLHIPQYRQVLACRDGDLLFMPAYETLHGVTPIRRKDPDGYRYTGVYYTVARMAQCLDVETEMQQARVTRSEREDTLIERQRESGLMA